MTIVLILTDSSSTPVGNGEILFDTGHTWNRTDAGRYTCTVKNDYGSKTTTTDIVVNCEMIYIDIYI